MPTFSTLALPFGASDASRITGVAPALQRDWRRHGYLPRAEGKAQFDLMDLASLTFMQKMAERGVGPKFSHVIAPSVALRIGHHASLWRNCWTGDVERVPGETWAEKASLLAMVPSGGEASRFLVWGADGSARFTKSVDALFNATMTNDPFVAGAVIVLDLEATAGQLLDAASGPLLKIIVEGE